MPESLLILLPGYNVARHLPELIGRLRQVVPHAEILVVDDGSADGTGDVAREQGATVADHGRNRGKGEALKTGFAYALEHGHDVVMTLDADLQHLPEEIPPFLDQWREGCAVVVGSRMHDNDNMPWLRKRTNEFTSWVVSRLADRSIPDSQSGFRLFARDVLARVLPLESSRYDMESEILIKAGRLGYSIGAVPITSVYQGQHSSIHPFVDTLRFLRLIWRARRWR